MKVNILNQQDIFEVSQDVLSSVVKAFFAHENITIDEISIFLVDDKKISDLHNQFFNDSSPTDCISFPIDKIGTPFCYLGDIFISTETALAYAKAHNLCPFSEVALYLVHGLLHLIGYNDVTEKDLQTMRKKEKSCIHYLKEKKLI